MDVQTFENDFTGQQVISAHGIKGQCVSVTDLFIEKNGWPDLYGATAYSIWQAGNSGYQKIVNTAANFPSVGDLLFFGPAYGNGAGHTGVVKWANANQFCLVEQNDPYGSGVHEKVYSYYGVMGWFHHPSAPAPTPSGFPKQVTITVPGYCNVRTAPNTSATLATDSTIPNGHINNGVTITVTNAVQGGLATANGRTSSVWFVTSHGFYISETVTNA